MRSSPVLSSGNHHHTSVRQKPPKQGREDLKLTGRRAIEKTNASPATSKATSAASGKQGIVLSSVLPSSHPSSYPYSEDHRGNPDHPGRVVTLISHSDYLSLPPSSSSGSIPPSPGNRVWGAAYHIPTQHVREVQEYLDIREVNGYSIQYAPFQPASSNERPVEKCMIYIGLPSNPQFLGPQDMDALARRIWRCKGPSGENCDYLFMLEDALKQLGEGAGDEHVEELARRVHKTGLENGEGGATIGDGQPIETLIEHFRSQASSQDPAEETEKS
ncbi:MAG: hypothetical protein L6R40_008137 [Gallowayella cf. fulva]|nr:MAG: hypothetical protein L6R40_008137 [Xanthomendoza cf. fulva]